VIRADPADYAGEVLCPRCGRDWRKYTWPVCAEFRMTDEGYQRWPHAETCERYEYGDLCDECEYLMQEELAHEG
jgi:hypothetical protein